MNKNEHFAISAVVPKDAFVMSAADYAECLQFCAGIKEPKLNRAQRRELERNKRHAK